MNNRRKICVFTGTRAEYGLLKPLLEEIAGDPALELQLLVSGMHLAPEFGLTWREIEADGFAITGKVEMLLGSDSPAATAKAMGLGLIGFADFFAAHRPDILVVLGDRSESFAAATAALTARIPIAHLCGGEATFGAIDEAFRHGITKMSSLHFPAAGEYRRRIIQLGEDPRTVFNYGHPQFDNIRRLRLLDRKALAKALDFSIDGRVAIATLHPETLTGGAAARDVRALLAALDVYDGKVVFTKSNCDEGGREINAALEEFCARTPERYKLFDNLGQLRYLSCLEHFDLMLGNSSSGIVDSPWFAIPVVNIGERQAGRMRSPNIVDTGSGAAEIRRGIRTVLSADFRSKMRHFKNPYAPKGSGGVAARIKDKLKTARLDGSLLRKRFYDISHEE